MEIDSLGYVIGVILGDGCVTERVVIMNTKDQEFATKFASALSEAIKDKRIRGHLRNWYGRNDVVPVYERERHPSEWANGRMYVVQKGMKHKIPELKLLMQDDNIRTAPQDFKLGVISGLFDSEGMIKGSHGRNPVVSFSVTDLELMWLWQDLCSELLGLHAPVGGPTTNGQYYIDFCGMEKCSRFFAQVPITIDRKRRRWQQLLEGKEVTPYQELT